MRTKTASVLSAVMAGLLFTGAAVATSSNSSRKPTHAVLRGYAASSTPVNLNNCPTLEQGSQGDCVTQLQTELNTVDNAGLPVDGIFGMLTQQAVVTFQQGNGLSQVDGIVGPATMQALDLDLNSVATPTPGAPVAAPAPSAAPGPPLSDVVNCGIVTCTTYFSRSATKAMDSAAQSNLNATLGVDAAGAAGVCGLISAPLGGPYAAGVSATVCGILSAEETGSYFDQLHNAAQAGQCFAVRTAGDPESPQYGLYGPHYLVRSDGYCHD
jgi:peptidoglycan hydrolase-like protein with peptidoglycan-binding domain